MTNSTAKSDGHLKAEDMLRLKKGGASVEDRITAMTHISECDRCAASFAGCFGEEEFLAVSPGFFESVLKTASAIQAEPKKKMTREKKRREFYIYSARVSLAMCLTLMLLFSGAFNAVISAFEADNVNKIDFSAINAVSSDIRTFSDKLVQLEVYKNDQKKK